MLLAIDAGNTNIVFAVIDGDKVRCQWRAVTSAPRTADEYAVWLSQLMALESLKLADIDAAIISTVVPQALFDLRMLCRRYFKTDAIVVGEDARLGMPVNVERPNEVGADRLVNSVAAYKKYGGPLIVIDFGTATTFDVVGEAGDYQGGVIASGVNLSLQALHMAAAKLPHIAVEKPGRVIGKGTVPAMQSGVYWGYVGLIEGLVARIKQEFGQPMRVIATGGLSSLFSGGTAAIDLVDPDLTVEGLLEIFRRTRQRN